MKLLHLALHKQNYDLAAHILVYGLIKAQLETETKPAKHYGNKKTRQK